MLPPGHIAAGYLTAKALVAVMHPALDHKHIEYLLWWGTFFGFAPDLDYFYVFFRERAFTVKDSEKNNHRKLITHAPVLWLIVGLLIYLFANSVYYRDIGLLLWLGSWSHFILDSIEDGVMWLWPFSSKQLAFRYPPGIIVKEKNFFKHWLKFLWEYRKRTAFYFEVLIIIISFLVLIK